MCRLSHTGVHFTPTFSERGRLCTYSSPGCIERELMERQSKYSPILNYAVKQIGYQDYEEYLSGPHWRSYLKKYKVSSCWCCSASSPLAQHHLTYKRLGCELPKDTITLCFECHDKVHQICKSRKATLDCAHLVLMGVKPVMKLEPRKKKVTKKKLRRMMRRNKVSKSSKWMTFLGLCEWRNETPSDVAKWLESQGYAEITDGPRIRPTDESLTIRLAKEEGGSYFWNRRLYRSKFKRFANPIQKVSRRRHRKVVKLQNNRPCEFTIELTQEMVSQAMSVRGGWTMQQLALIGIPALTTGWKHTMVGRVVGYDNAVEFVRIREELKATGQDLPKRK